MWFWQKSVFHLCEHTRDALALVACETEIYKHPYNAGIAAVMDTPEREQRFRGQIANQSTWAGHFHAVIK